GNVDTVARHLDQSVVGAKLDVQVGIAPVQAVHAGRNHGFGDHEAHAHAHPTAGSAHPAAELATQFRCGVEDATTVGQHRMAFSGQAKAMGVAVDERCAASRFQPRERAGDPADGDIALARGRRKRAELRNAGEQGHVVELEFHRSSVAGFAQIAKPFPGEIGFRPRAAIHTLASIDPRCIEESPMSAASLPTIEVPLTFIAPATTRPRVLMSASHAEANRRTGDFRSLPVDVADARSLSEPPTLDGEGFALETHRTSVADFYALADVEQIYYAEIAELLRGHGGPCLRPYVARRGRGQAPNPWHEAAGDGRAQRLHGAIGTAARARRPCAGDGRTLSGRPVCNSECLAVVRSLARTLSSRCRRRPHGTPDRLCRRCPCLPGPHRRDLLHHALKPAALVLLLADATERSSALQVFRLGARRTHAIHRAYRVR